MHRLRRDPLTGRGKRRKEVLRCTHKRLHINSFLAAALRLRTHVTLQIGLLLRDRHQRGTAKSLHQHPHTVTR